MGLVQRVKKTQVELRSWPCNADSCNSRRHRRRYCFYQRRAV